jgi:hypothetical protein
MTTSAKVGKWVSQRRWHLYFLLLLLVMDSESWALIRDAYKLERHVNACPRCRAGYQVAF